MLEQTGMLCHLLKHPAPRCKQAVGTMMITTAANFLSGRSGGMNYAIYARFGTDQIEERVPMESTSSGLLCMSLNFTNARDLRRETQMSGFRQRSSETRREKKGTRCFKGKGRWRDMDSRVSKEHLVSMACGLVLSDLFGLPITGTPPLWTRPLCHPADDTD